MSALRARFTAVLFGALVLAGGAAEAKLATSGTPEVGFVAMGPANLRIRGKSTQLTVADDAKIVTLTVPVASLSTDLALRDRHMQEALESSTYPSIEVKVARDAIKWPADAKVTGDAPAQMTLHGQTRPVTLHYTAEKKGAAYEVEGTTRVDITDFGITPPGYRAIKVKPGVDIDVRFTVTDN